MIQFDIYCITIDRILQHQIENVIENDDTTKPSCVVLNTFVYGQASWRKNRIE
jgi:hypothetical protein